MFESEALAFAQAGLGSAGEDKMLEGLCAAACSELLGRLKQGVEPESIKDSFAVAAGVLALSMYTALGGGRAISFRAGNLAVTQAGEKVSAESLRQQAEGIMSAYLADQGFEFRSVEG